jgi:hypothetical protein
VTIRPGSRVVRVHDLRHAALTTLAANGRLADRGRTPLDGDDDAVHLAGVVLRNEADTLAERVLRVQDPGTNTLESALVREEA